MKKLIFDVECYKNYMLVMLRDIESRKVQYVEMHNDILSGTITGKRELFSYISGKTIIGFNSMNYDIPMITAFMRGYNNRQLKKLSDYIVTTGEPHWKTTRKFNLRPINLDHIDIKEPTPGVMVSLKIYGGRLNAPKLQDLPIEPDAVISDRDAEDLRTYCVNDLDTTEILYKAIVGEIELRENIREEYGTEDLRSKGGAQVATAVLARSLEKAGARASKRTKPVTPFKYIPPKWVKFDDPVLNEVLKNMTNATFKVKSSGHIELPNELKKSYSFNGLKFQPSIGGLHSKEKRFTFTPNENQIYEEADCQSFYPKLIIEEGYTPSHLDKGKFLKTYKGLLDGRVADKTRMYEIKKEIAELERQINESEAKS